MASAKRNKKGVPGMTKRNDKENRDTPERDYAFQGLLTRRNYLTMNETIGKNMDGDIGSEAAMRIIFEALGREWPDACK